MSFLRPYTEQIYAVFRIVFAFLYLLHGFQKVFGLAGGQKVELASMFGAAGIIEILAGLLILTGLYAAGAAFIASGEMASAYFIAHLPNGWNPLANGGERPILFSFGFLYIAARGSGVASLDRFRRRSS